MSKMTSWHVGVAAEAFTAAQFARHYEGIGNIEGQDAR